MLPVLKLGLLLFGIVLLGGVWLLRGVLRRRRHRELRALPFPREWEAILEEHFPLYGRLTPELQQDLQGKVQIFLDEKSFEGAGGFEVTDVERVSIAAQACFLLLNRRDDSVYPGLLSIVIYPSAYKHKGTEIPGVINDGEKRIAGESWGTDLVVLAWNQVERGAKSLHDGQNVVFHEFAHQLDAADGSTDGVPVLERGANYKTWALVCQKEYDALVDNLDNRKRLVFDRYGATNPAEFFAVATESFFERPVEMHKKHPELYAVMCDYYRQDPLKYFDSHGH